ncbi:integration host factor subunit alpha [Limisalsivibrio acetivorans]|uniref:integration host factor subunit alpha n=1 Tax=Limisalsivibrio acetivorans TaxID=1304888 RepID=UPI0003B6FD74|nr:integration host factor subunit alpha [Limisalsivibrio acetivorans]
MTKADIVEQVHESLGLTKKDIAKVVDEVFTSIRTEILEKDNVKISGFGNFEVKKRGRRIGRNPKTGVETVIEPRTVVVFRPSQIFKDEVNG